MLIRLVMFFLMSAGVTTMVYANDLSGRVDVSYSEANPDYSPFPNGEGVSVYGRLAYEEVFVYARHSDAQFKPSGPVSGEDVELWQEAGLGYRHGFSEQWALEAAFSYQRTEQESNEESGQEWQLGASYKPMDRLALDLSVGKLDLQIDDWNLDFESRYRFYENTYLVLKLRDYADWDFTYYEAGLGVHF